MYKALAYTANLGMGINYMKDFKALKSKHPEAQERLEKGGYKALVCDEEAQGQH